MSDIHLINDDCLNYLAEEKKEVYDLVITSPPYNVGVDYGQETNDDRSVKEYHNFAYKFMKLLFPVVKFGGRVCFEIGGDGRDHPLSWLWQDAAYKAGFGLFSQIVMQHRKTNQTAWGSWMDSRRVYTVPNFHQMYVFYKEVWIKESDGRPCDIERRQFIEWTRGWWKIQWSNDNTYKHPAKFPVELPMRCMKLFGHVGDWVLDPFSGVATTAVAAIVNQRNCVGIELSKEYHEMGLARVKAAQAQPNIFDTLPVRQEIDTNVLFREGIGHETMD